MDLTPLYPSLIALIPGIEVRGSIIYSYISRMSFFFGYFLPLLVSMAIVPIVYMGFDKLVSYSMRFKSIDKFMTKTRKKVSRYVDRYGFLGLMLFVAIPLPGSGLYTGALGAIILGLDKRKAIPALYLGNLIAFFLVYALVKSGFMPTLLPLQ